MRFLKLKCSRKGTTLSFTVPLEMGDLVANQSPPPSTVLLKIGESRGFDRYRVVEKNIVEESDLVEVRRDGMTWAFYYEPKTDFEVENALIALLLRAINGPKKIEILGNSFMYDKFIY